VNGSWRDMSGRFSAIRRAFDDMNGATLAVNEPVLDTPVAMVSIRADDVDMIELRSSIMI